MGNPDAMRTTKLSTANAADPFDEADLEGAGTPMPTAAYDPVDLAELVAIARDTARRAGSTSMARLTIGVAPLARRARISMVALGEPHAPTTGATVAIVLARASWWSQLRATVRRWYARLVWARRRRLAMRRTTA